MSYMYAHIIYTHTTLHIHTHIIYTAGCHVAYHDADWIVGVDEYRAEDIGLSEDEEPPDMSLDPV